MELDDYSRFGLTEKIIFEGNETFGRWSSYNFLLETPTPNEIRQYVVNAATEGRPDIISNIVYGTPLMDWVILAFNNVTDLNWPRSGETINYPIESIVMTEILQRND